MIGPLGGREQKEPARSYSRAARRPEVLCALIFVTLDNLEEHTQNWIRFLNLLQFLATQQINGDDNRIQLRQRIWAHCAP